MKINLLQLLLFTVLLFSSVNALQGAPHSADLVTYLSGVPATPAPITGPAVICPGQIATYSVEAVPEAISYIWTVPNGWVITAGQGVRQISVVAGSNSGHISVVAENNYGRSGDRKLEVQLDIPPSQPGALEGPTAFCAGSIVKYKVEATVGSRAYFWSIPSGWTIISGQGTSEIEIMAISRGGMVHVIAANSCGQSAASSLAVTAYSPVSNNQMQGAQVLCAGQTPLPLVGSAPSGGDGTYTYLWESSTTSADEGFVAAAGVNNNINYTPSQMNETTWFRRTVLSGSCLHVSEAVEITVEQLPGKPAIERTGDMELRTSQDGASYEWRRNGVLLDSRTQTVAVEGEGTYDVRVISSSGCVSPYSDSLEILVTGLVENTLASGVRFSLHPGRAQLQVTTQSPLSQVELKIVNLLGHELYRKKIPHLTSSLELELGHLPDGVYLLLLQAPNLYLKQKLLLQR